MDLSAAEVKRATMPASPSSPQTTNHPISGPNGSEILVRCLQAEGVKFLSDTDTEIVAHVSPDQRPSGLERGARVLAWWEPDAARLLVPKR